MAPHEAASSGAAPHEQLQVEVAAAAWPPLRALAYALALSRVPGRGGAACAHALRFLQHGAAAREAQRVSGEAWSRVAREVVAATATDLVTALSSEDDDDDSGAAGADVVVEAEAEDGDEERAEWERLKLKYEPLKSEAMDELMAMSGMRAIKLRFMTIFVGVALDKRRGYKLTDHLFNVRLEGNPGSGKTTVARLYARLLQDLRIFRNYGTGIVETSGADLADQGIALLKSQLDTLKEDNGGVLVIDEAYALLSAGVGGQGKQRWTTAATPSLSPSPATTKTWRSSSNKTRGLPSRFPETLTFEDYSDAQLLAIFKGLVAGKRGTRPLQFEPGPHPDTGKEQGDRWARVAIARLGRRRGARGFANARAVLILFDKTMQRQTMRLKHNHDADPYIIERSDLLGEAVPDLSKSAAWQKLQCLVGLESVKRSILNLAELVKTNAALELEGRPLRPVSLNKLFLGNPGTGKTTVARLYARILRDLGLLSKGEAHTKTASDFIGSVLGESETKTRSILQAAKGSVCVIDEAYGLHAGAGGGGGGGGVRGGSDPYHAGVIDTLVEQIQNVPGEDRAVLMLGYREDMERMLKSNNPGLERRFALNDAFNFADYTDEELLEILDLKMRKEHLTAKVEARLAAVAVLARRRDVATHFGNGGEVDNLLREAKVRKEGRRRDDSAAARMDTELVATDFDPEYGREPPSAADLTQQLFGDLVGCEGPAAELARLRAVFLMAKSRGIDPLDKVCLNFRFTGSPGTGKTTVARRMGRMFKELGVLQSDEVISCSPADFTTGFAGGQAAIRTKEMLNKALGRTLFIDEAYGLNPQRALSAGIMQEVVDQIVQSLTDERFRGKLVVILAGYPAADMDALMTANAGLASRFGTTIHFPDFTALDAAEVLRRALRSERMGCLELSSAAAEALPTMAQDAPLRAAAQRSTSTATSTAAATARDELAVSELHDDAHSGFKPNNNDGSLIGPEEWAAIGEAAQAIGLPPDSTGDAMRDPAFAPALATAMRCSTAAAAQVIERLALERVRRAAAVRAAKAAEAATRAAAEARAKKLDEQNQFAAAEELRLKEAERVKQEQAVQNAIQRSGRRPMRETTQRNVSNGLLLTVLGGLCETHQSNVSIVSLRVGLGSLMLVRERHHSDVSSDFVQMVPEWPLADRGRIESW
ncbi:P-loop containing nucleoside triphosphate hydrolase protein [Tribonema minus]|uniref:P-loop containing nucleoside triphosphate hydrolase protein n=1 Tax=Tribonema minus TaxID=303371 RepID=A0A835ZFP4_9STRA|nr:P-loop containing nucleoside triphosphate hydrolase protein [Tribonema minus]